MKTEFKSADCVAAEILTLLNDYTNDIVWQVHRARLELTDYDVWFRAYYRGKDFGLTSESLNALEMHLSLDDQIRIAAAMNISRIIRVISGSLDNDSSSLMIPRDADA